MSRLAHENSIAHSAALTPPAVVRLVMMCVHFTLSSPECRRPADHTPRSRLRRQLVSAETLRPEADYSGMSDFEDPHTAAARVRMTTQWLTAPQDVDVARRYIADLEMLAQEQDAEEARRLTPPVLLHGFRRVRSQHRGS